MRLQGRRVRPRTQALRPRLSREVTQSRNPIVRSDLKQTGKTEAKHETTSRQQWNPSTATIGRGYLESPNPEPKPQILEAHSTEHHEKKKKQTHTHTPSLPVMLSCCIGQSAVHGSKLFRLSLSGTALFVTGNGGGAWGGTARDVGHGGFRARGAFLSKQWHTHPSTPTINSPKNLPLVSREWRNGTHL